jgi:hypothetical protein
MVIPMIKFTASMAFIDDDWDTNSFGHALISFMLYPGGKHRASN